MATKVCFCGAQISIEMVCAADGTSEVGDFLDSLDKKDRRKIDVLFELMGVKGRISNSEKFKKLEGSDGIFEFKSFQIRLLCFFASGKRLILCRGVIKKRDKHDPSNIKFAEQCKRDHEGIA